MNGITAVCRGWIRPRRRRNMAMIRSRSGGEATTFRRRNLDENDERYLGNDPRYASIKNFPKTECLKDTVARVVPYWNSEIAPKIVDGKRLIVAAHGNSLRRARETPRRDI